MDKVFSVRLDENLAREIDNLSREKALSKKAVVEKALRMYLNSYGKDMEREVVNQTFGAWQREEPVEVTWQEIRGRFNRGMARYEGKEKGKE